MSLLYSIRQAAELIGDRIRDGMTAIFAGHNHVISVRHGTAGGVGILRAQREASPALVGKGFNDALHAILHRLIDHDLPSFDMMADAVLAMARGS